MLVDDEFTVDDVDDDDDEDRDDVVVWEEDDWLRPRVFLAIDDVVSICFSDVRKSSSYGDGDGDGDAGFVTCFVVVAVSVTFSFSVGALKTLKRNSFQKNIIFKLIHTAIH